MIEQILAMNLTDEQKNALLSSLVNEKTESNSSKWENENRELKEKSRKQAQDTRKRQEKRDKEYALNHEIKKMEDELLELTNDKGEHIYTKEYLTNLSLGRLEEEYYRCFDNHKLDDVREKYYSNDNGEKLNNSDKVSDEFVVDKKNELSSEIDEGNEIVAEREIPTKKKKLSERWKALPKWKKIATAVGGVLGTAALTSSIVYFIYNSIKAGDANSVHDSLNNVSDLLQNKFYSIKLNSGVIDNLEPIYQSSNDASLGVNGMEPLSDARHTMVGTVFDTSGNQYDANTIQDVINLDKQGIELGSIPVGDAWAPDKISGFVNADDVINAYSGGKVR